MPTEVILPKVDMDMATGQISRWFYQEGDTIKKGEPLFEIETDKAAMEVDAPASGTLRNVTGAQGVDIAVGSPVAWIYAEGEAVNAPAPTADAGTPGMVGPDPDVETDSQPAPAESVAALANGEATEDAKTCCAKPRGVRATPLARRIAHQHGIDLASVSGTGPLGRIGRDDVENLATAKVALVPTPAPARSRSRSRTPAPTRSRLRPAPPTPYPPRSPQLR